MKRNLLLLTLLFSCMLALQHCQCKKEDNAEPSPKPPVEQQLPPITTEGKMTFGCKVNGKVWLPYSSSSSYFPLNASVDRAHNMTLSISADINNVDLKEEISFKVRSIKDDSIYQLNKYPQNYGYYYLYDNHNLYMTDSIQNGYITILRFDSVNQIISGTFYFNAYDSISKQTVNITDGRFDMHFSY